VPVSWIRAVSPEEAGARLAHVYARIASRSSDGRVSQLWRACGLDPAGLDALDAHEQALMADPSPLSPGQAEMLAVVVSAVNGCGYGVAHHGPRLANALADEGLARAVARDYREANLAARDRVMLDAAVALSCEPSERTRADVDRLREYGFDDAAILRLTAIAAFYNLVSRIASGLGVELEDGVAPWEFGEQR
jgi:uncharacterized peroxidase-related enzyme